MTRRRREESRQASDATVRAALAYVPASIEYDRWFRVAMALKSFYGEGGFEVFDRWSATGDDYLADKARAKWRDVDEDGGVGIGTLFRIAQDYGFDLAKQYAAEEAAEAGGTVPRAQTPSPEDRERAERERRERDEQTKARREREQLEAAEHARQRWAAAAEVGESPYLEKKRIPASGARFEPDGVLLVPMYAVDGVLWNVQAITPDDKRSPKGSRVKGLACWIGDPAGRADVVLCEGFATGATLHAATGYPVLVTFNAGNLVEVARAWMGKLQGPRVIVAADDDRATEARTGKNPGREAGQAAARLLGGVLLMPEGLPEGATDFNDLAAASGLAAVADQVARLDAPTGGPAAALRLVHSAGEVAPAEARQGGEDGPQAARKGKARGKGGGRRGGPPGGGGGDDADGDRADPFLLTEEGVFYVDRRDGAYTPRQVCAPIEVIGLTRNLDGWSWGKLVRFTNRDGEVREWILPDELFAGDGVELRKTLAGLGLWMTPITGVRARLVEYFETRKVPARVRTVGVTGWSGEVFVLPGESIGSGEEPVVYHAPGDPGLRLEQRGTLEGWQQAIGRLAVGNTRLLFAVSVAFAAPLLALSGERNGGFHLRGTSQDGKTTALSVAASVFSAPAYVRKWRATDNAIESVAALHSDLPLLLDELHQCSPRVVGDVAYLLAEGQGKARGERAGGLRSVLRWRSLFLSTGETGLAEYMATAGVKTTAGQEMRFAEIPAAPENGHGVFEELHDEPDGASFALRLREAVGSEYGTAGRAWLQWLVAYYAEAADQVQEGIRTLAQDWVPAGSAGQVESVARRFALVAVAGEMATRAGITGWRVGTAVAAVRQCFEAWVGVRGGTGRSEERDLLRRLQGFLQTDVHRLEYWERAHDDHAGKTLNRAGFRKRFFKGEAMERDSDVHRLTGRDAPDIVDAEHMTEDFYVFEGVMRADIFGELDQKYAHRVLVDRGILKTEKNGDRVKPTRRERLPGGAHSRVYVITSEGRARLDQALEE